MTPPACEADRSTASFGENGRAGNFFTVIAARGYEEDKAFPRIADLLSRKERRAMAELPYDPDQETERLSAALSAVYKHWGTAHMAQAYRTLVQALARAEQTRAALARQQATQGGAFTVQVLGLDSLLQYAREELARIERAAPALVGKKKAKRPAWC